MYKLFFIKFFLLVFLLELSEKSYAAVNIQLHTNLLNAPAPAQTIEDWWVNHTWPALQEISWYGNIEAAAPRNRAHFVTGLERAGAGSPETNIDRLRRFSNVGFIDPAGVLVIPGLNLGGVDFLENILKGRSLRDWARWGLIEPAPNRDYRHGFGKVLSLMDLTRQQPYTTGLLHQGDVETNDLQKIQQLSGTFCIKREDGELRPSFSGMVEPAQDIRLSNTQTVKVLTCFHGFEGQKLANLYFVPYDLPQEEAFAFKVKHLKIGRGEIRFQEELDRESDIRRRKNWEEILSNNDYVECFIDRKSADRSTDIEGVLKERGLLDKTKHILKLRKVEVMGNENIFVFGRPGEHWLGNMGIDGYTLVTNMKPFEEDFFTPYYHAPKRMRNGDENPNAEQETLLPKRKASSYSAIYGMSGGPVVFCGFQENNVKCQFAGVVNGAELSKRIKGALPLFRNFVATQ